MKKEVISYLPSHSRETHTSPPQQGDAIVTEVHNHLPVTVTLNEVNHAVMGYYGMTPGLIPSVKLGDHVYVVSVVGGVRIMGVEIPPESAAQMRVSVAEGNLIIEATGSVILKNAHATIELTRAGEIRINGKNVHTVADSIRTDGIAITTYARERLTLLGGNIDAN